MRRRWKGASIALVAVVALGAGCSSSSTTGSGGGSSTTAAPPGTSPSESTTTTAKGPTGSSGSTPTGAPSDVEAALIEAGDLGPSWSRDVSGQAPSESVNQSFLGVPACAALAPSGAEAATAESASADYDTSDGTDPDVQIAVQYQVDRYPDEGDATAVVSVVESAEFASCFETLLTTSAGSDGTVSNLAVTPLELPSASSLGVDAAVGVEVTGTATSAKGTADMVVHLVVVQHGSALGLFTVTVAAVDGATAPPLEVQQSAVEAAATKLVALGS
jgi:hypothetical protein